MAAPQYREVIPEDSLEVEGQQKAPDYTFRVGHAAEVLCRGQEMRRQHRRRSRAGLSASPLWLERQGRPLDPDRFRGTGRLRLHDPPAAHRQGQPAPDPVFRLRGIPRPLARVVGRLFARGRLVRGVRSVRRVQAETRHVRSGRGVPEGDRGLARCAGPEHRPAEPGPLSRRSERRRAATIDRVVFLRMAEDRGLEPYGQLLKLCEQPDIYARFMGDLCRKADEKYNSGLFHFQKGTRHREDPDRITPGLTVDDKVFKPILQSLYFEHGSPYQFGVLPVEILGTVYERFLGKVIRLTAGHQAKVEEKPEVRKAGGVYYTPAYIVDYIVKQHRRAADRGQKPDAACRAAQRQASRLRVLDMACGSRVVPAGGVSMPAGPLPEMVHGAPARKAQEGRLPGPAATAIGG